MVSQARPLPVVTQPFNLGNTLAEEVIDAVHAKQFTEDSTPEMLV